VSVGAPSYHPNIRVEAEGHVTTVVIDNPEAKNACNGDMWVALGATFRDLAHSGTRAIILTGSGGEFCAGADLTGSGGGGSVESSGHILHGMRVLGDVVLAVHDCPVPIVAKVDGVCVGAGLGLALAADMIWCSERARFSAIFAKRGLSLDFGTSWLLRQRVGIHRAKEITFTGRVFGASEALALGMVNAVVPTDQLDVATREVIDAIAAGPPLALSSSKRELDNAGQTSLAQALETEALAQSVNAQTDDMREALVAYAERRPTNFSGR
jgi:2-(1,2-epoxy-1,2-dihydrophenyl)acetyl-CoA isomerase